MSGSWQRHDSPAALKLISDLRRRLLLFRIKLFEKSFFP